MTKSGRPYERVTLVRAVTGTGSDAFYIEILWKSLNFELKSGRNPQKQTSPSEPAVATTGYGSRNSIAVIYP